MFFKVLLNSPNTLKKLLWNNQYIKTTEYAEMPNTQEPITKRKHRRMLKFYGLGISRILATFWHMFKLDIV